MVFDARQRFRRHPVQMTVCSLLLLVILASLAGHFFIFSNQHLMDFAYREISYTYLADKITNSSDPAVIARNITDFVHKNVYLPIDSPVIDDNPWDILYRGYGYCDQLSFLVTALMEKKGIPARWLTFHDKENNEVHSVVEAFVDGRWEIYDPLYDFHVVNERGQKATLEETCQHPEFVLQNDKVRALEAFTGYNFTERASWYCNPVRRLPIYGQDRDWKRKIVVTFLDAHYHLLDDRYARLFQSVYLKRKPAMAMFSPETRLYFKGRQYHLYRNYPEALDTYAYLIKNYPEDDLTNHALLFSGIIYCRNAKAYDAGIAMLQRLINITQDSPNSNIQGWDNVARYYLGRCYEEKGDIVVAMNYYNQTASIMELDSAPRFVALQEKLQQQKASTNETAASATRRNS